ncbi:MAG: AAA family ATPase [Saprospiraceae bacterium]
MNLPTSARALLIALQTPTPKGTTGIPVILWGPPGVGKSSFLESLDQANFPVLTLIASIHDPTDFSGLPVHNNGSVQYAVPEWVQKFDKEGDGLLFLDELTTAPPSVQAALLRVVLERKVGFHPLPKGVRIVAAANPPDLMVGGWDLSPPLRNRFVHLQWDLPTNVYIDALSNGFPVADLPEIDAQRHAQILPTWKLLVAAFLKRAPNLLHGSPEENPFGFASPRTWDYAAHLLAACELAGHSPLEKGADVTPAVQLLTGALGEGTTIAFMNFVQNIKLPDPAQVLDGEVEIDVSKLNDGEVYVLFGTLNNILRERLEDDNLHESVLRYFDLLEAIFEAGKRDLVYVSMKQIIKEGLLTRAMAAAQKDAAALQKIMTGMTKLFSDTGLNEFIEVFEH